ncbi:MAG TPA: MFS transporter [Thermomicrobiales bacterium]|nr:MFS transporter [Thermomicrobiales bacterium]
MEASAEPTSQPTQPAAPAAYRVPLAVFVAGQFITGTGNRINAVALPLLVIERYGVGLSLGLVTAARLAPRVLLGPLAGAAADRLPRRAAMAVTLVASAALVAAIPLTGALWQLYLLAALVGLLDTLLRPAGFALRPEVFPAAALYRLNTIEELLDAGTNLVGPTLAVALVGAFGTGGAFEADALSFIAAALALLPLRPLPPGARVAEPAGAEAGASFGAVWRLLRGDATLTMLLAVNAVYTAGIGVLLVVYAPLALDVYRAGDWGYGALVTATGLGALAGVLLTPRLGPRLSPRLIAALLAASGLLLVALAPLRAFWPALVLLALAHLPESCCYLVFATESQRRIPTRLLGRYYGVAMTALAAALPLGNALGGLAVAHLDPRAGVGLVGLAFLAAAGAGVALARRVR